VGYRDPACPSQDELAEELAAELDGSQIDACLALTPNERLERLRALLAFVETANDRGDRSRPAH
jgi:hypothetical protein